MSTNSINICYRQPAEIFHLFTTVFALLLSHPTKNAGRVNPLSQSTPRLQPIKHKARIEKATLMPEKICTEKIGVFCRYLLQNAP